MLSIYLLALDTEEERLTMTKLYNRHSLFMLRYALKITKNPELAEDAVHDAFLKVIDNKEKYFSLSCSDFRVRIVSIVKNRCIDILKRKGRLYDDIDNFYEEFNSVPPDEELSKIYAFSATHELRMKRLFASVQRKERIQAAFLWGKA